AVRPGVEALDARQPRHRPGQARARRPAAGAGRADAVPGPVSGAVRLEVGAPARSACLAAAHGPALLADLEASGARAQAAFCASSGGYGVLVVVMPSAPGEGLDGLSDCDRDCLALLAVAAAPLSAVRVRREIKPDYPCA